MTQPIDFRDYEPDDLDVALTIAVQAWPEDAAVLPPSFIKAEIELYRALSTWAKVSSSASLACDKARSGCLWPYPPTFHFLLKYLVTEIRDGRKSPDADGEILLLMVDSNSRGLGIGRKLVDNFLAEAKNLGDKSVRVCTDEASNWRFYENYGFRRYSDYFDEIDSFIHKRSIRGICYLIELK